MRYRQHSVIGGTQYIPVAGGYSIAVTSSNERVDTTRDESFILAESSPVSRKWLNSVQFRWFCDKIGQTPEIVERRIGGHDRQCLIVLVPFSVRSPSELAATLTKCAAECNLKTEWVVSNPGAGHLIWEGSGTTAHMLGNHAARYRNRGSKPSRTRCVSGNATPEEIDRREAASDGQQSPVRHLESDEDYGRRSRMASRWVMSDD